MNDLNGMSEIEVRKAWVFQNICKKNNKDFFGIMQSEVYLLQEMGVDMGYDFVTLVCGCHSSYLTDDIFDNYTVFMNKDISESEKFLTDKELRCLDVLYMLGVSLPSSISYWDWLSCISIQLFYAKKGEEVNSIHNHFLSEFKTEDVCSAKEWVNRILHI